MKRLLLSLVLALAVVAPAWAVYPVTDATLNAQFSSYASAFSAFSAQQGASNRVMNQYALYMEGGGTGNGVIELLMAQNNQLAKIEAYNDQFIANKSQQERADKAAEMAAQDNMNRRGAVAAMAGVDTPGCEVVTTGMTAGGAHAASGAARLGSTAAIEQRMTANRGATAAMADLVSARAPFCSAQDVQNHRPGCGAVGPLPNADIDAGSLSMGAVNKTSPQPTNHTFTPEQTKAAQAYINNVLPMPGAQPQGDDANTQAGRLALVQWQRYTARLSTITDTLASIAAMRAPMETTPEGWDDHADAYGPNGRIFKGQAFPAKPSEMEVLRYAVYEAYQDPKKSAEWESMDPATAQREQLRLLAVNARVNLLVADRLEQVAKLLAINDADRLDPVHADTLQSASNHR